MNYLLAFERNNNDYVPIDFRSLGFDFDSSLKGIDDITKEMTLIDFLNLLKKTNMYDEELLSKDLVIIYKANGKLRKAEFGVVFSNDQKYLKPDTVLNLIVKNLKNKDLINRILNFYLAWGLTENFESFLVALKEGANVDPKKLSNLFFSSYEEQRSLGLFLKRYFEEKEELEKQKENESTSWELFKTIFDSSEDEQKLELRAPLN